MRFVSPKITRKIARQILVAKKNSPHIFFVGGVVGVVGAGFLACRATLQLESKLDEIKNDVDASKADFIDPDDIQEVCKQVTNVTVKSAVVLGRLYAPSFALGAVSVAALTGSHIQLTRRNAALSATLALVTKAYDEYRIRVRNEFGEEKELDLYRGLTDQEVVIDGKKQIVKVYDPDQRSPYSRIFDEFCPNWEKDSELNRMFLTIQQSYINLQLNSRGHVFLNEVYDIIGLERSRAGAIVGWLRDGDGDGFIDFGMFEAYNSRFINNMERSVILDFNVDGVINEQI